nr:unnamed protein product [Digitaria exilis]
MATKLLAKLVVEPPLPPADDLADVLMVVRLLLAHGGENPQHVPALPEQHVADQLLLPPHPRRARRRGRRSRCRCRYRC